MVAASGQIVVDVTGGAVAALDRAVDERAPRDRRVGAVFDVSERLPIGGW